MNFIKLHTENGDPVWINEAKIQFINLQKCNGRILTCITLQDGDYLTVTETPEIILGHVSPVPDIYQPR